MVGAVGRVDGLCQGLITYARLFVLVHPDGYIDAHKGVLMKYVKGLHFVDAVLFISSQRDSFEITQSRLINPNNDTTWIAYRVFPP